MSKDNFNNSARVSKNIIYLYIRMILLILISLYTSRIVLKVLGVSDFGIYNAVGGIVSMLGFIQTSLSGASSRFLSYSLGTGNKAETYKIYSTIQTIHYCIAIIILILAETIGLIFLKEKLTFPPERLNAVLWVYQTSVLSIIMFIISIPSIALLIAFEKMKALAYFTIIEAVLKLILVSLLSYSQYDKLILYSILLALLKISIRIYYSIYCRVHLGAPQFKFIIDKKIMSNILSFIGLSTTGSIAAAGIEQGMILILNIFFGPIINASQAIANQIKVATMQVFANFQQALRPQITKTFAQKDFKYMHRLLLSGSRISIFLMIIMSIPIIFQTDYILKIWLGKVPNYTKEFILIYMFGCYILALKNITNIAIQATGKIKKYQFWESLLLLLTLPVSYILLKYYTLPPYSIVIAYFIIEFVAQIVRINITYPMINLLPKHFYTKIILPIIPTITISIIISYLFSKFIITTNIMSFILNTLFYIFCTTALIYIIGLNKEEKGFITKLIKSKINILNNKN